MTRLIFLGGFLGSGKTTTLLRLAGHLTRRGNTVGILTNDQGDELVDTELFRASGLETRDVRGGCFCCRLTDFVGQAEALMSTLKPDFLLAEPVGSCTDLIATVLRPLRHLHPDHFEISPFTVLVDPLRARNVLSRAGSATLSDKVTYVYKLQQMEADAIAVNKADILLPEELADVTGLLRTQFPAQRILTFSARTGEGFDDLVAWLLGPNSGGLSRSPEIDYDVYAAGEAELAWFDGRFGISAPEPIDMDQTLMQLGSLLCERLSSNELQIAHVKLFLRAAERVCSLSIPRSGAPPELSRSAGICAPFLDLLVNARVAARPDQLATIMEDCLQSWAETLQVSVSRQSVSSFSPPRPVPTYRVG
jgi:Ni2+-binding GTPase involved in maturation of urease and hydrogenase